MPRAKITPEQKQNAKERRDALAACQLLFGPGPVDEEMVGGSSAPILGHVCSTPARTGSSRDIGHDGSQSSVHVACVARDLDTADMHVSEMDVETHFSGADAPEDSSQTVLRYRLDIIAAVCKDGDDMPPCLQMSGASPIDAAVYALPDRNMQNGGLVFSKYIIAGLANVVNAHGGSTSVPFCNCCPESMHVWYMLELEHHSTHLENVADDLLARAATCHHAQTILQMASCAPGGTEGVIQRAVASRAGMSVYLVHGC